MELAKVIRGKGGFGVAVEKNGQFINVYSKQYENITNNQGELKGLLFALGLATEEFYTEQIHIYSDSAYTVNLFNSWIHTWAHNGWLSSKGETIKNLELVQQLYKFAAIDYPNFKVEKTMGHCGILGNEIADAAASNNQAKLRKIFLENEESMAECKIFDF